MFDNPYQSPTSGFDAQLERDNAERKKTSFFFWSFLLLGIGIPILFASYGYYLVSLRSNMTEREQLARGMESLSALFIIIAGCPIGGIAGALIGGLIDWIRFRFRRID